MISTLKYQWPILYSLSSKSHKYLKSDTSEHRSLYSDLGRASWWLSGSQALALGIVVIKACTPDHPLWWDSESTAWRRPSESLTCEQSWWADRAYDHMGSKWHSQSRSKSKFAGHTQHSQWTISLLRTRHFKNFQLILCEFHIVHHNPSHLPIPPSPPFTLATSSLEENKLNIKMKYENRGAHSESCGMSFAHTALLVNVYCTELLICSRSQYQYWILTRTPVVALCRGDPAAWICLAHPSRSWMG